MPSTVKRYLSNLIFIAIFFCSCSEKIKTEDFPVFLNEPAMIVNLEQDNTIEGTYLRVGEIDMLDSSIKMNFPSNFFVTDSNCKNWVVGWGMNKPLYDAGVENLRRVERVDSLNNIIHLGPVVRGGGFPDKGQRMVFWNIHPSGFRNLHKTPIINPAIWPAFHGKEVCFGPLEFDSTLQEWVMLVNECGTDSVQIYAATSKDLTTWLPANNGRPIIKCDDFVGCSWAGSDKNGKFAQTPYVSDVIRHNGQWFLFMDGYGKDGKRNIGVATSVNTMLGPYTIHKKPLIQPGAAGSWNDEACFYAKVKKYNKRFILFYDGRNAKGSEKIGVAYSDDLLNWKNAAKNPVIDQHTGWRSFEGTTEPNYIEVRNDSIFLLIAGVKKFKAGPWHHYITRQMYMDKSGNVNDAQLGFYLSTDGGNTFVAHKNNPVFTNDYSNPSESDHMGGNFKLIKTDTTDVIIYQAKSDDGTSQYNVLQRVRKK